MTTHPVWAKPAGDGWILSIRVQPAAGNSTVVGEHGNELRVRVAAPPNEGKANAELIKFLARRLGIPRSSVSLKTGEKNRSKAVLVSVRADLSKLLPRS